MDGGALGSHQTSSSRDSGRKNEESITTFDKIFEQIIEMADGLSDGVIAQFPDKF